MSNIEWDGQGLPPVGIRCEAAIPHTSGPDGERRFLWIEGSVIAYHEIKGNTYAWFAEGEGFYQPDVLEFRPIRTQEQIAAEEREQVAREIRHASSLGPYTKHGISHDAALTIYDAGYRKQVTK